MIDADGRKRKWLNVLFQSKCRKITVMSHLNDVEILAILELFFRGGRHDAALLGKKISPWNFVLTKEL